VATPLDGLEYHRLLAVPRRSEDRDRPDPTPAQLFASLTGAHATFSALEPADPSAMLAMLWVRPAGEPQIRFLVGGRPFFPPAGPRRGPAPGPLLYPPGATGEPARGDEVDALLGGLPHWVRCHGLADALWDPEAAGSEPRRGSFDDHAAGLLEPFAWLVLAEPLAHEVLEDQLTRLTARIPGLRQRENTEAARLELERAQSRFRELTRARSSGIWDVRVVVGAASPPTAVHAASLLCSASDLEGLPYVLIPEWRPVPLQDALTALPDGDAPFIGSTELLAALARPPARELPGIRLVVPHRFDVTPENATDSGFVLGTVLDASLSPAGPLRVSRETLNRHALVCGATGSGKSQTIRSLLESIATDPEPVPWLVIEPAKAEYAGMRGRLRGRGEVLVIQPGDLWSPPGSLNPLEPAEGYSLQSHVDLVRALFLAAFEAQEPFPQVLSRALTECYLRAGWDLVTGRRHPAEKPKFLRDEPGEPATERYPVLGDLQAVAQRVVESIGYGDEVTADVRGFVDVRIGSLRQGRPGRFFEGGHPLDIDELLRRNVVLEIEGITNDQDKAFLMGAVLIRIVEHLRVKYARGTDGLRHVIVVEEAHRLLKNVSHGPAAAAVELFAALLAEIRAYGEGVVVVEQIPSKLLPDVIKNTAMKVMHRLPAADDRESVGATMNLQDQQSEAVVALAPGVAAAAMDGMDRPLLVRMVPGGDRESVEGFAPEPPLCGRRSRLCGPDCQARACTLSEMNAAQHHAQVPEVVVWVEAVVAAHLVGLRSPTPSAPVRSALRALDRRTQDCTLAHAVDRAIHARRELLQPYLDAGDLAERVRAVLRAQVDGDEPPEGPDHRRWTAGPYRWSDVRRQLRAAIAAGHDTPHPATSDWARRGLFLDGATPSEQFEQLRLDPAYGPGQEWMSTGDPVASGLRAAVSRLTGATTPEGFRSALTRACEGPALDSLVVQMGDLVHSGGAP
jgi:DNA helicase HerA-like ATPase